MSPKPSTHRQARKIRVRAKIHRHQRRLRLHVYRSARYIYAQIIDDAAGRTLVAASQKETKNLSGTKTQKAAAVGQLIAQKAKKAKITQVVFDRGAYKYHGRIKSLAEAARAVGLEF